MASENRRRTDAEPSQKVRRCGSDDYSQPTQARAVLLRRRTDARMQGVACLKSSASVVEYKKIDAGFTIKGGVQ